MSGAGDSDRKLIGVLFVGLLANHQHAAGDGSAADAHGGDLRISGHLASPPFAPEMRARLMQVSHAMESSA